MASTDYPKSWGPITDPAVKKWWDSQSSDNKKSWNLHSQLSNDGMIKRHNDMVTGAVNNHISKGGQFGKPLQNKPQPEQPGAKPRPIGNQPSGPTAGAQPTAVNYQSGINVGGGIGKSGVLSGLLNTGNQPDPNVATLARATAWNDASQIGRGIDAQNQQLQMEQQAKRSESSVAGLNNLAKIYGDMAERGISQKGLAAQIAANNIGFAAGVAGSGLSGLGGWLK